VTAGGYARSRNDLGRISYGQEKRMGLLAVSGNECCIDGFFTVWKWALAEQAIILLDLYTCNLWTYGTMP